MNVSPCVSLYIPRHALEVSFMMWNLPRITFLSSKMFYILKHPISETCNFQFSELTCLILIKYPIKSNVTNIKSYNNITS